MATDYDGIIYRTLKSVDSKHWKLRYIVCVSFEDPFAGTIFLRSKADIADMLSGHRQFDHVADFDVMFDTDAIRADWWQEYSWLKVSGGLPDTQA